MAESIQFLHTPKLVGIEYFIVTHRDLKPANLLQQTSVDYRAAVTDFDLSEILYAPSIEELKDLVKKSYTNKGVGTPFTVDPYVLRMSTLGQDMSFEDLLASDIWSLGMTMLDHTFSNRMLYKNILGGPEDLRKIYQIYSEPGNIGSAIAAYFKKTDDQIIKENPGITRQQINSMRDFIESEDYKQIVNGMLNIDPKSRIKIDKAIEEFRKH